MQQQGQEQPTSKSRPSVAQYRDVCFTLHDYNYSEVEHLQKLDCEYIIFGKEECPETGRPHLQGFVILKKRMTLIPVKRFLLKSYGTNNADRIHVEKRVATRTQASRYCRGGRFTGKPNNSYVYERGEYAESTSSVALRHAFKLHEHGEFGPDDLESLSLSDLKAYEKVEPYLPSPERGDLYVEWIWGRSGVGKTRFVYQEAERLGQTLYKVESLRGFWNGYHKHKIILLDDFAVQEDKLWYRSLIQLLDRYPVSVDKKYGGSWLYADRIYITAQHPPWYYWQPHINGTVADDEKPNMFDANEELVQVMRRINIITKMNYNEGEKARMPEYREC